MLTDRGLPNREIHKRLESAKGTNYSTTVKMLAVMLQKGLVKRNEKAQPYVYRAALTRAKTGKQMLDDLIKSRPTDVRLRSRRALALARSGDVDKARVDLDFVRQTGTGGDLYTLFRLAIAEEIGGSRDRALATLGEAMRAGFSFSEVQYEPDLVDLRKDPRFHHILVDIER